MNKVKIDLPLREIEKLCKKWRIIEFALFGSVLREDFNPQKSDIDVLVVFSDDSDWELFDIMDLTDELRNLFRRKVDLVDKKVIEKSRNPYRKQEILGSYEVIYEQAA